jgi:hypothetical protein
MKNENAVIVLWNDGAQGKIQKSRERPVSKLCARGRSVQAHLSSAASDQPKDESHYQYNQDNGCPEARLKNAAHDFAGTERHSGYNHQ